MGEKLTKLVEGLKALAYLAVAVSVGYSYLNKDSLLKKVAIELKPYIVAQVDSSIIETVPTAVKIALENDDVVIKIDANQFRQFTGLLNANKLEILEGMEIVAETKAKLAIHDFMVIEKEITNPATGETLYLRGILIGKDALGRDDWIFRISETKSATQ